MSLFGLFKEKDCDYYLKKGKKFLEKEDFYNALINFEKALEKKCYEKTEKEIREKIELCRKNLAEKNLELARAYFEAGDYDEAIGFAETCVKYAEDEEMKKEAEKIIEEIEKGEIDFGVGRKRDYVYEDVEDDEYFEIISGSYPDFIREDLEKNGELKEICIAINRGDIEKASKIENFEKSLAADYMKALYYSLKENYEKAFEFFNPLFEENGKNFSEAMLVEFLELIRKLDKGDELIEKVLEAGGEYLDVVKLAASIYLERGNVERSEELVNYGFEIMDKFNPDEELIATAGLLHFTKKDFQKCVDFLGNLKEVNARRGYFVFPSQLAVPLAISYSQIGKHDEAFELLLHLLKEEKDPEVIKLAKQIAEKSRREDLKKQLKYLVKE